LTSIQCIQKERENLFAQVLAANLDIKTYDVANFFVNVVDSSTSASWGKLWVDYEVEFYTPQTQTSVPNGVVGGRIGGLTSQTGALPFGTAGAVESMSKGITYNGSTGDIILEKTGTYLLAINYTGTTLSAPVFSFTDATQIGGTTSVVNGAATSIVLFIIVTADATNARITPSLTAATVTGATCMIGCGPTGSYV
jgi:hypothetical protein